ncbi:MAG: hypothetical protein J6P28_03485 [Treponema sp.]|nr:hypothetical protein [Treponema sp.]
MTDNLLKAVKRFNKVMDICEELNVLKVNSDGTLQAYLDGDFKPTCIEDLIKESEYQLSIHYESGHSLNDLRYEHYKEWKSQVGMLKRLIAFLNKCKEQTDK